MVKNLISRMKRISNLKSNTELAKILNVSYNTFNTWLKRGKIPQEVLYEFCIKFECSFDYLLLESLPEKTENANLFYNDIYNNKNSKDSLADFVYYGIHEELGLRLGDTIKLHPALLISNGYYLLKNDSIYAIAKVEIDIVDKKVFINFNEKRHILSYENFNIINIGLITDINKKSTNI